MHCYRREKSVVGLSLKGAARCPTFSTLHNNAQLMSERQLEKIWPNIHRLMRDADDVDEVIADDIEDDVATFGKASVTWMNVVPFATCERMFR